MLPSGREHEFTSKFNVLYGEIAHSGVRAQVYSLRRCCDGIYLI
jgi:hypothetical protein